MCEECGLFQIDYYVDPDYLYRGEYLYKSSTTKTGREHYSQMARDIASRFGFGKGNLAVDIGSNVGVLLQGFKDVDMDVLGVDPAEVSRQAIRNGIDTLIEYFESDIARKIEKERGKAHVITGTNVFAHLHEIDDAVQGMKELLHPDGVIVIEAPYVVDLLENLEYDTIYHQHIGYLSVRPMQKYFERFGLELFDVAYQDIHGGTLRYFVGHKGAHDVTQNVGERIEDENKRGIYTKGYLDNFRTQVQRQKRELMRLLMDLQQQGKRVSIISTPAKGNTLLNYCHIDNELIEYSTEKNELKIGRYTPGTHITIHSDSKLLEDGTDYALILAWNFAPEIIENMKEYRKAGGKFIVPIPNPRIVE
jgi:SAM-dependent methyltransferase